jgi:ABC-2 type transport system ATP-binding protein
MDEAERCHQLAILETGHLRKQGSPETLMKELEQRVVEVSGDNLRRVKERALQLPRVQSAAQLGLDLRVLLRPGSGSPVDYLQQALAGEGLSFNLARPNLEDVFVASTDARVDR